MFHLKAGEAPYPQTLCMLNVYQKTLVSNVDLSLYGKWITYVWTGQWIIVTDLFLHISAGHGYNEGVNLQNWEHVNSEFCVLLSFHAYVTWSWKVKVTGSE